MMTPQPSLGTIEEQRTAVVDEARCWIGTPFHHGARLAGIGVDCAQLLIAVYGAALGVPEPVLPAYAPDWFLHEDREHLVEQLRDAMVETKSPEIGDVAVFRYGRAISHAGIVTVTGEAPCVVHSFRSRGVVEESIAPHHALAVRLAGFWTLRRWAEDTAR